MVYFKYSKEREVLKMDLQKSDKFEVIAQHLDDMFCNSVFDIWQYKIVISNGEDGWFYE